MTTLLADLGGTRLKSGVLGPGDAPPQEVTGTPHRGRWREALQEAVAAAGADQLALAVPGLVDAGRVVALPGKLPGVEGADLEALLGVPVRLVVNDAVAFAVGEAVHGAAAGAGRVLAVTLGTGVGVAVVEDGRPLGSGPLGGGLLGGQLPLGDGRTIEQACCAAAFDDVLRPSEHDTWSGEARRDPVVLARLDRYRADLARALTVLTLAHAPDVVVVGGGVAATPELLLGVGDLVRAGLWRGQSVEVRLADRTSSAALAGLAALLRERVAA